MRYARVRRDIPPFKKNTIVKIIDDSRSQLTIMHHQDIGRGYLCKAWEVEEVDNIQEIFLDIVPPVQLF